MKSKNGNSALEVLIGLAIIIVAIVLVGALVAFLFNIAVAPIFNLPIISPLQGLGLIVFLIVVALLVRIVVH